MQRWTDDIKDWSNRSLAECSRLARDRPQWRLLVNEMICDLQQWGRKQASKLLAANSDITGIHHCCYCQWCVLFTGTKVTTYSLHPGAIRTELTRHLSVITDYAIGRALFYILSWPLIKEPWNGAQTTICCAVDSALASESGKYYRWDVLAMSFIMAALWNRAGHCIFALWFVSSSFYLFFPRLISAVRDWMSTILPHTVGVALVRI